MEREETLKSPNPSSPDAKRPEARVPYGRRVWGTHWQRGAVIQSLFNNTYFFTESVLRTISNAQADEGDALGLLRGAAAAQALQQSHSATVLHVRQFSFLI
jgi:hypothetical protein